MFKNWKLWVTILALGAMIFGTLGSGAWFSDQAWLVIAAKGPGNSTGAKLACRPVGDKDPFSDIWHTKEQVLTVLKDFDALNTL